MSDIKLVIGCFVKLVLLDDNVCSGADPVDWMASHQSRLAKQFLGGVEQRVFLPAWPQDE